MAVDKNLFPYDLAGVAIFKDEGRYLKEWLDYHLLAGVEHFFLYNNDSSDDYKKILAPYVEKNLVTLTEWLGKAMQYPAYNDVLENFRFTCRFMAFIDLDEFIFPKTNQKISEVVDEILSSVPNAAGLGINWQIFGSNGHEKADYSRGVLERFTRRASKDRFFWDDDGNESGTAHVKIIANPRLIRNMHSPHHAVYFDGKFSVNSNGEIVLGIYNFPVLYEKIVVNHYCIKNREEFLFKQTKRRADRDGDIDMNYFITNDQNEIFDDGILKYRAARAEKFSLEDAAKKFSRTAETLTKILSDCADGKIFDLETALTCRAAAHALNLKVHEEASLAAILKSFGELKFFEVQLLRSELPNLLSLPYPAAEEIRRASIKIFSQTAELLRQKNLWKEFSDWNYLCRLLQAWR